MCMLNLDLTSENQSLYCSRNRGSILELNTESGLFAKQSRLNTSSLQKVLDYFKNGNPPIYIQENGTNIVT